MEEAVEDWESKETKEQTEADIFLLLWRFGSSRWWMDFFLGGVRVVRFAIL